MKKIILIIITMLLALSCACSVNNTAVDNSISNSANNTVANSTNNDLTKNTDNNSTSENKPSFEIYLAKNKITTFPCEVDVSQLDLEDKPLLTDKNISEYVWESHKIKFLKYDELKKTLDEKIFSKVPVSGKPFVVVCNGERIYLGFFWTAISSLYYPESAIISADFPDRDYFEIDFSGEIDSKTTDVKNDVRNDKRIYETFKKLGKLK